MANGGNSLSSPEDLCPPPIFLGQKDYHKLHNIIHKQWIYHNSVIHFKGKDGWTLPEQHTIMSKVVEYSMIIPDTILLCHWFLLDTSFEALGSNPTSQRLLWLAEVDTAFSASSLSQLESLTPQASAFFLNLHITHIHTCISGRQSCPHHSQRPTYVVLRAPHI